MKLFEKLFCKHKWINVNKKLPNESGRYWCYVKEVNSISTSYYQWNCAFNFTKKSWSSNCINMNVIYWTELLPIPNIK